MKKSNIVKTVSALAVVIVLICCICVASFARSPKSAYEALEKEFGNNLPCSPTGLISSQKLDGNTELLFYNRIDGEIALTLIEKVSSRKYNLSQTQSYIDSGITYSVPLPKYVKPAEVRATLSTSADNETGNKTVTYFASALINDPEIKHSYFNGVEMRALDSSTRTIVYCYFTQPKENGNSVFTFTDKDNKQVYKEIV